MPEVRRGSKARVYSSDTDVPQVTPLNSLTSPTSPLRTPPPPLAEAEGEFSRTPTTDDTKTPDGAGSPAPPRKSVAIDPNLPASPNGTPRRPSLFHQETPRKSLSYAQRPTEPAYYDSRAATQSEYKRRAKNLQEYYEDNPNLLPQLPFTWHHGWKRWRLLLLIFFMFVDACAVPVALYYGLHYAGDVEGWIIFAVVTTIWGGPTYLEFAVRSFRLIKKERFYRPLGTNSRWSFDMTHWASILTITVVTALFIIGSAPHIVWLRVLCMPGPAILYCLGGILAILTLYHAMGWKAPFRISSTGKGDVVLPGAYYFMEDVVAVNAGAGRPYREALAARYQASPRFRKMLYQQSLFWSIPSVLLAIPLTVIAVIHQVPATVAYGICWVVPFLWAIVWGVISTFWCRRAMIREREEWESDNGSIESEKRQAEIAEP